jgi:hypothetical protein
VIFVRISARMTTILLLERISVVDGAALTLVRVMQHDDVDVAGDVNPVVVTRQFRRIFHPM